MRWCIRFTRLSPHEQDVLVQKLNRVTKSTIKKVTEECKGVIKNIPSAVFHIVTERLIPSSDDIYFDFVQNLMDKTPQQTAEYIMRRIAIPLFRFSFPRFVCFKYQQQV